MIYIVSYVLRPSVGVPGKEQVRREWLNSEKWSRPLHTGLCILFAGTLPYSQKSQIWWNLSFRRWVLSLLGSRRVLLDWKYASQVQAPPKRWRCHWFCEEWKGKFRVLSFKKERGKIRFHSLCNFRKIESFWLCSNSTSIIVNITKSVLLELVTQLESQHSFFLVSQREFYANMWHLIQNPGAKCGCSLECFRF